MLHTISQLQGQICFVICQSISLKAQSYRNNIYNIQKVRQKMGCENSQMAAQIQPSQRIPPPQNNFDFSRAITSSNFAEAQKIADQYFRDGNLLHAIQAYQAIIEAGYTVDYQIQGLGNDDHSTYRYEWFVYRWYDEQRKAGKFKGNAFDALSLCISRLSQTNETIAQRSMLWYEDMLEERPCYQLQIGYANVLYTKGRYEKALEIYKKLMEQKPNIINIYISVMFLYEFKRVQKAKSIAMAKKILQMDPQNMYAFFVLGKNEKNVDEKIKKLTAAAQKFPNYIRCVNQVGLAYGAKKQHRQAIKWYKKCVDMVPEYAQGCNNIAFRTQMIEDYKQALKWYFKAVEIDPKYKQAFMNAIKTFNVLNYTDEDILNEMENYKMDKFNFFFYLGLAYYDLGKYQVSLTWYKRAQNVDPSNYENYRVYNSMGLAYQSLKDYDNGQKCYLRSISINPRYKFPPYNLGLLFKHKNDQIKAIQWYKKAIQVDPFYHPPYNNLGNIYRDAKQYQKAIDVYKRCVQIHSTYTLVYCNMAVCYLNQHQYQDAFNAFARAKELLPSDNNGLTEANKNFLRENIEKFDKQGEIWRKTGSIGPQEKKRLMELIKSFQSNFKMIYSSQISKKISDLKVLKPEILQIVNLIYEDKFELNNIDRIFSLVKHVFHDDEEYFHIIPQLFIQYFWNSTFKKNVPILQIEEYIKNIIKRMSREASEIEGSQGGLPTYNLNIKMKNFDPPNDFAVNLFKEVSYFDSYQILYSQIDKVNKLAQESLPEFIEFVEAVRKRSNGIPYGVNMKLPKRTEQQFKVILRILQKIFKNQINQDRVKSIISKIDTQLKKSGKKITLLNIVHEIMDVWTKEITLILQQRSAKKIQTTCKISDLVRGKIMFNTIQDLVKAIDACDKLCHSRGYKILELDNRLTKKETMDVVLKIKVKEAVCEFQLAMKQDQSKYHFIHAIYQIQRSPLGCIFGSYLFMSKGFSYPILTNCKDIQARLKQNTNEKEKATLVAAQYIISALQQKIQDPQ